MVRIAFSLTVSTLVGQQSANRNGERDEHNDGYNCFWFHGYRVL